MSVKVGDITSYDNFYFGVITEINLQKDFAVIKWFDEAAYKIVGKTLILWGYGEFWNKVS